MPIVQIMNAIVAIVMDTLLHTALSKPLNEMFAKPALNLATCTRTALITYVINVENMDTLEQTAPK
jgi:hypothetical protein